MLKGTKVILRAATDKDLPFLLPMRNDIDLQSQLMALPRPNTAIRVRQWLQRRMNDEHGIFFVIAEKKTNRGCGYIQLINMDTVHGTCYLGIWLSEKAKGKGLASEALSLVSDYAVDIFGIRKILLHVLADNIRAISFYKKTNFVSVGLLREHFYHQRRYHDVLIMEKNITVH